MKNITHHPVIPCNDTESNIPKLRFPEFENDGEWEEKTLIDVSEIIMGQSPDSNTYNTIQDGKPLIQGNADIFNRKTNPRIWTSEPTKECQDGDIILTVRAPVGAVAKSFHNACIGRGVCAIQPKESNEFLYQFLLTQEDRWDKLSQGSTFTAINSNDIRNFKLNIPKQKEQQKIADCLSSVDNLITAQSKKLQTLKEHKKALMQQLFPQDGEKVPKLRFPEFENDGEWEEKQLGSKDICYGISSGKDKNDSNGIFDLYGSTGIIGKSLSDSHTGSFILVARVGANAGFLTKAGGKFGVTDNTLVLDLHEEVNIDFVFSLLEKFGLNRLIFGSGQPLITGRQLKELTLFFPKPKEQQKIANFLSSIDELITSSTKKVETLKEHKKGLMQQLFPLKEVII